MYHSLKREFDCQCPNTYMIYIICNLMPWLFKWRGQVSGWALSSSTFLLGNCSVRLVKLIFYSNCPRKPLIAFKTEFLMWPLLHHTVQKVDCDIQSRWNVRSMYHQMSSFHVPNIHIWSKVRLFLPLEISCCMSCTLAFWVSSSFSVLVLSNRED